MSAVRLYLPYPEAFSSIRRLRTLNVMVTGADLRCT